MSELLNIREAEERMRSRGMLREYRALLEAYREAVEALEKLVRHANENTGHEPSVSLLGRTLSEADAVLAKARDALGEKQPCGHPMSDQKSATRCKHGCIYGCLEPKSALPLGHEYYQDAEARFIGQCDYTFPDGDYCGQPESAHRG